MKIMIAGVGKLGQYLARELASDGNEVTIVDYKPFDNKEVVNNEEVYYVNGNALDSTVLNDAGASTTDILISVMDKDEKNIMCSFLGKKLGVKRTIARVRTPEYSSSMNLLKEDIGLSMLINPEYMTAAHIARILSIPNALDSISFFKGRVFMVSIKVKEESTIEGLSLHQLSRKLEKRVIICAIERNGKTIIPKGNDVLEVGDKINITGTRSNILSFLKFANLVGPKPKRVMISGGSSTAQYLAKMLLEMGMYVKIIEINEERCKELSEALPDAVIINGDVSNQELLYEENIEGFDSFISLNNIDEENIVHSMFAKGIEVPNVITKVNHIKLDGVIEKADIDTIVTPHKIASNQIVRYVRAMSNSLDSSCESIYKFDNEDFEMVEFIVKQGFKGLNTKLKDLKIKDNIIVVAILRGKDIIFPTGNDEIKTKDTVVLAVDNNRPIKDLNNILE